MKNKKLTFLKKGNIRGQFIDCLHLKLQSEEDCSQERQKLKVKQAVLTQCFMRLQHSAS